MNNRSIKNRILIFVLIAIVLVAASVVVMAGKGQRKTQMSLPFALPRVEPGKVMPPDPDEWCKKVDLAKLDYEVEKAEAFFETGYGQDLVRWKYLRRALSHTGVTYTGAEDEEWLQFVKGMFKGCTR